jgi:hypothetical protein
MRSQMGTKLMKFSRMVDRTGNTSCQYLTAGFSALLGMYGTTCWMKKVRRLMWSGRVQSVFIRPVGRGR